MRLRPDQVRQLLTSIDRRTAIGRRDYAILLLLARLGLRSGEVVFLELDDIDWNVGQLSVHGKNGTQRAAVICGGGQSASPRICGVDDPSARVAAYFYAPKLRSAAFKAPAAYLRLCGIPSSAPE